MSVFTSVTGLHWFWKLE